MTSGTGDVYNLPYRPADRLRHTGSATSNSMTTLIALTGSEAGVAGLGSGANLEALGLPPDLSLESFSLQKVRKGSTTLKQP